MLILEINGNQHYDLDKMELLPYYQKRHDEIEALGWEVLEIPYNQSYSEEFRMGLCRQLDAKLSSKQSFYAGSSPANPLPYLKTLAELKKDRLLKKQQQVLEKAEQVRMEKERKRNDWLKRKELILNCGVDLTRFGWVRKVEITTGLTKRVIENTVKYFDLEVFKRKPRNVHSKINELVK